MSILKDMEKIRKDLNIQIANSSPEMRKALEESRQELNKTFSENAKIINKAINGDSNSK